MAKKSKEEIEAMLSKNDAGAEAVKRQQEATADVAVADEVATPEQEEQVEPEQKLTNPVDETVVNDVIAGKYGTGAARVQKLAEAGYDPDEVQAKVNETVKAKETAEEEKAAPEEQVKEIVEQKTETEQPEENATDDLHESLPDNVKDELMSSDEGQAAQEAIDGKDPAALQNIVGPDGNPLLNGGYDSKGRYKAHTYTPEEAAKMQNKGWAGAATIISVAISALGALFGLPIVPINFYRVLGTDRFVDALNQNEKDYEQLVNAGTGEAQAIEKTEDAKTKAYESNAKAVIDNPELYESDVQNKVAGAAAALGGGNTELQVQEGMQDWQQVQNELDRQFQKEMKDKDISGQIAIMKQNGVNQKELATLMNDLEVQEVFKKAAIAEEKGMSPDDLAKWIRGMEGVTKLQAYAPVVGQVLGSAIGLASGLGGAAIQGANMAKQAGIMSGQNSAQAANNAMLQQQLNAMKTHPEDFFATERTKNGTKMKYMGGRY